MVAEMTQHLFIFCRKLSYIWKLSDKSSCNSGKSKKSLKTFVTVGGLPKRPWQTKRNVEIHADRLLYDTTESKLVTANHSPGAQCRCSECSNLKDLEDKWIMKISPFYGQSSLNTRDEIKAKTRFNFKT